MAVILKKVFMGILMFDDLLTGWDSNTVKVTVISFLCQ